MKNKYLAIFIFTLTLVFSKNLFSEKKSNCEATFTRIYDNSLWSKEYKSGTGSDLTQTTTIRHALPELLKKYNCSSIADAPCGDFYWMKKVNLPVDSYIGIDIVKRLIEINQETYGNENYTFQHIDITMDEIPQVDLVLCRDCLVHLSYNQIANTIRLLKSSGSKYLLTTSFTNHKKNKDIRTGSWRTLNLQIPPFNFPKPLEIINENCTQHKGNYKDKCLLLWEIASLPDL